MDVPGTSECGDVCSDMGDVCWICLEGASAGELRSVCKCPRKCHQKCLARWQLHSAGKSEEKKCRFCDSILDDWKPHLMAGSKVSTPYMRVSFNGGTHKVQVQPGPEGAKAFEKEIRDMLQLPEEQEFDVIFHCRAPGSGDKLQLQGLCAFDAAVHCASMTSWPTASQQHAIRKQQLRAASWLRQLFRKALSRLDIHLGLPIDSI
eukprot:GHUV01002095.1.p1 GENE.GHUV01002095.1~~GHUV01002095.1.p1  ORF type:complete len:205 (+),score=47.12 GHUV01002095.1:95-709(+)